MYLKKFGKTTKYLDKEPHENGGNRKPGSRERIESSALRQSESTNVPCMWNKNKLRRS